MAQDVFSTQFFNGPTTIGAEVLYTVPAGKVALINSFFLFNGSGHVLSLSNLQIGPPANLALVFVSGALALDAVLSGSGRWVLNPADIATFFSEFSGLEAHMSGYLLNLP